MQLQRSTATFFGLVLALSLIGMLRVSSATLLVEATVTANAGAFHYEVAITNNTPDDVILVSLIDAPSNDPLISSSVTTPAGFLGSYDPLFGIVDFLADLDVFGAGTTVSGLSFDSMSGPLAGFFTLFEALTEQGELLSGEVRLQTQVVPEPATIVLFAIGLGGLIFMRQRRCQRQAS